MKPTEGDIVHWRSDPTDTGVVVRDRDGKLKTLWHRTQGPGCLPDLSDGVGVFLRRPVVSAAARARLALAELRAALDRDRQRPQ